MADAARWPNQFRPCSGRTGYGSSSSAVQERRRGCPNESGSPQENLRLFVPILIIQTLIVMNDLLPKVCLTILEHFLVSSVEFNRKTSTDPDWVRDTAQEFLAYIALGDCLVRGYQYGV